MNDYDLDRKQNTKKRYEKAKKRSETWIDKQLELLNEEECVLLPVSVLNDEYQQKYHLEFIAEKVKNKRVIGLTLNGDTRMEINENYLDLIKVYTTKLNDYQLPICCFDLSQPKEILSGVKLGVTGFGGQYGLIQAQNHRAIILPNKEYPTRRSEVINMTEKETLRLNTGIFGCKFISFTHQSYINYTL